MKRKADTGCIRISNRLQRLEEFCDNQAPQEIMTLTKAKNVIADVKDNDQGLEWEKMILKVDSGAIDTCIPKGCAQAFELQESAMSKAGVGYQAANGTPIENHGQRNVRALAEN